MRVKIVAGNWKMNNDFEESKSLVKKIAKSVKKISLKNTRVIVAPSFISLRKVVDRASGTKVEVAAQNMHFAKSGAYTGEISANMIKSVGVKIVILGHSERREYFNESDDMLEKKVNAALENNLEVIFCFGEVLADRKEGKHFDVVKSQIKNALFKLDAKQWKHIILAYEPVWAIGTGETATPEQAQEMHAFIRKIVAANYTDELAQKVSILYGGSVKPGNAKEIFSKPDVDGGLIGGASLNHEDFKEIIEAI